MGCSGPPTPPHTQLLPLVPISEDPRLIFVKANGSILTHFLSMWLPAIAGFGQRCPSPLPPQPLPCTFQFLLKIEVTDSGEEISRKQQMKALDTVACTKVEVVMIVTIITTSAAVADSIVLECGPCSQLWLSLLPCVLSPNPVRQKCHHFTEKGRKATACSNVLPHLKKKE